MSSFLEITDMSGSTTAAGFTGALDLEAFDFGVFSERDPGAGRQPGFDSLGAASKAAARWPGFRAIAFFVGIDGLIGAASHAPGRSGFVSAAAPGRAACRWTTGCEAGRFTAPGRFIPHRSASMDQNFSSGGGKRPAIWISIRA